MSVITNGLVLPLIAASIRTAALSVMLPLTQRNMAKMGHTLADIDAALGTVALTFEAALALPAITLLMRNPSLGAAVGSAFTLMALEVFGKQAYLGYYRLRHEGDPVGLRTALDTLEVRLVYEEVGEKLCLLVAPFLAYSLDRDKEETETASVEQLAFADRIILNKCDLVPKEEDLKAVETCVEINQCVGCTNRHRHAIEQAARRWRERAVKF